MRCCATGCSWPPASGPGTEDGIVHVAPDASHLSGRTSLCCRRHARRRRRAGGACADRCRGRARHRRPWPRAATQCSCRCWSAPWARPPVPLHRRSLAEAGMAVFATPEQAVRGFLHLVKDRRNRAAARELPSSTVLAVAPDRDAVRRVFATMRRAGVWRRCRTRRWPCCPPMAFRWCRTARLPRPRTTRPRPRHCLVSLPW